MIKRILIANRGEIASRVIKTCREMNIHTVAVYSDVDKDAPYVRQANESYPLGHSSASLSYLNQEKIIAIAKQSRCDAIHPGYGFLSENSAFARNVISAGLLFIGPSPEVMKLMGDKTSARKLAQSLGIPTLPGSIDPVASAEMIIEIAERVKLPVLLKAVGGGGGKGMRVVRSKSEITSAFNLASSEALSSFGDDRIYVEKYIENPRHVEVQILADTFGNVVHLGERECSIQRRHQKIIEESPACSIDEILRKSLSDAAVELARACKYTNAGTIEFILDKNNNFYFLEMNTRLQVEHPVTEMRTGIDIVREQIKIAEGKKLKIMQEHIIFSGNAIECRIYAEDPANNFFPSSGFIEHLHVPSGLGIRIETAVEEGSYISTYYDPMIAKIITWDSDRTMALRRMSEALNQYEVFGIRNNIYLCLSIINHPDFMEGKFNTHFVEDNFASMNMKEFSEGLIHASILVAISQKIAQSEDDEYITAKHDRMRWKRQQIDGMR